MIKVRVLSGELLIGFLELQAGDPPSGGAFGSVQPTAEYEEIRQAVIAATLGNLGDTPEEAEQRNELPHEQDALSVTLQLEDGTPLEYMFVDIFDVGDALGPDEPVRIEASGVGNNPDVYQEYFGTDEGYVQYYGAS